MVISHCSVGVGRYVIGVMFFRTTNVFLIFGRAGLYQRRITVRTITTIRIMVSKTATMIRCRRYGPLNDDP